MFYNTVNPLCVIEMLGVEVLQSTDTSFVALIRSFDDSPVMFDGELNQEAVVKFAKKHELPVVINIKEKMIDILFAGELASVFMFVPNKELVEKEYGGMAWF